MKIIGGQAMQPQFQEVIKGTSSAWVVLPQELAMWTMVDQMARLSVNEWTLADERKAAISPFYLVTTPEQAKALVGLQHGWPGPAGFKEMFKKLWGV